MEKNLSRLVGNDLGDPDDPLWRAQEIMYEAWDATQKRARVAMAKRALEVSPLCADAYVLLASDEAKTVVEARDYLMKAVAAGEEALGAETFKQDAGHFWGLLETRPYMRARAALAEGQWALGHREQAIGRYQDLLRLNPNDNQGLRYILATHLMTLDDRDALEALIADFPEDDGSEWRYARAVLAFRREGASQRAYDELRMARRANPHTPAFPLGSKSPPRRIGAFISLGGKDEAALYVAGNASSWSATPGALEWLDKAVRLEPHPEKAT